MASLLIMALKEESQGAFEQMNFDPHYSGVGLVKASFYTQKWISEYKPKHVFNLGTAGSFSIPQGSLIECSEFTQRSANNYVNFNFKPIQNKTITDLPKAKCGSADFIEKNNSLTSCDVMDMEAYAIAYVCSQLNVPFTSIKYVSDSSNENLIQDWKLNLKKASLALVEIYEKIRIK